MKNEYRARVICNSGQRISASRFNHGSVCHVVRIAQPIEGPQVCGRRHFVGQRSSRMLPHQLKSADQPSCSTTISKLSEAKHRFTYADYF